MQAFESLYTKYYNEAMLYACSLTHDRALSEDLVAEAFTRALRSIDPDRDGFKYWLFKVCRNLYYDYLRKAKRVAPEDENLADEEQLVDSVIKNEEYRALYKAISLLVESQREVIRMFYFNGLSVKEIAGITDLSVENVKVTLYRARVKLKKILEGNI